MLALPGATSSVTDMCCCGLEGTDSLGKALIQNQTTFITNLSRWVAHLLVGVEVGTGMSRIHSVSSGTLQLWLRSFFESCGWGLMSGMSCTLWMLENM